MDPTTGRDKEVYCTHIHQEQEQEWLIGQFDKRSACTVEGREICRDTVMMARRNGWKISIFSTIEEHVLLDQPLIASVCASTTTEQQQNRMLSRANL